MNDLQAQLEEANKEKQELQEKVGTRSRWGLSPLVERGCGVPVCGGKALSSLDGELSSRSLVIQKAASTRAKG